MGKMAGVMAGEMAGECGRVGENVEECGSKIKRRPVFLMLVRVWSIVLESINTTSP